MFTLNELRGYIEAGGMVQTFDGGFLEMVWKADGIYFYDSSEIIPPDHWQEFPTWEELYADVEGDTESYCTENNSPEDLKRWETLDEEDEVTTYENAEGRSR